MNRRSVISIKISVAREASRLVKIRTGAERVKGLVSTNVSFARVSA